MNQPRRRIPGSSGKFRKRDSLLQIRLFSDEKAKILAAARAAHCSVARLLTRLVDDAPVRRGSPAADAFDRSNNLLVAILGSLYRVLEALERSPDASTSNLLLLEYQEITHFIETMLEIHAQKIGPIAEESDHDAPPAYNLETKGLHDRQSH